MNAKTRLLLINTFLRSLNGLYYVLMPLHLKLTLYKYTNFQFQPRPDDIFVVSYPKSGTTWVLAMVYQLVTDGSMAFNNINHICPPFAGWSRDQDHGLKSPRIFKSHHTYDFFPKYPGRFIYIYRNGADVAVSWYHHMKGRLNRPDVFAQCFDSWMKDSDQTGPWAPHVAGWLRNPRGLNILYLKYEDVLADREGTIRKIAAFCNVSINESNMPRILERTSFEFMKEHEIKFDPRFIVATKYQSRFFRKGQADEGKTCLTPDQIKRLREQYVKHLAGFNLNYF